MVAGGSKPRLAGRRACRCFHNGYAGAIRRSHQMASPDAVIDGCYSGRMKRYKTVALRALCPLVLWHATLDGQMAAEKRHLFVHVALGPEFHTPLSGGYSSL